MGRSSHFTPMTNVILPDNGDHFKTAPTWIILRNNIISHLKEREVTMSPIFDVEDGVKNYNLPGNKYIEIHTSVTERDPNNLHHPSREAAELLMRLNELANGNPFNIMYKARINDPR